MRHTDKRFQRYMDDVRFHQIVKVIEGMLYSDHRMTYDEILDAAFVAYVKYRDANPTLAMQTLASIPESGEKDE